MEFYSGKLLLLVCFPFKLLWRKALFSLNVLQANEATVPKNRQILCL